ncbi:multidrug resistance protein [Shewanella colwelliana]|uniref:Multidrug resistance protein n=1 Tax=Shewanella colwelliana TaxID=23 RepID=A0ABQ4NYV6_SHECO|nr:multidrug resistance protein [Shewanella colwelliana]GIU40178.1 multidrug resistance protein [Shewanella colwelliana]
MSSDIPQAEFRPVKVTQFVYGQGTRERILPGEVRASDRAVLSFRVAGEIANILVSPGDEVRMGDPLATLDPAIYEQQRAVAKAQFELAKVLFERASNLVEQGVVSRGDFDQSKSEFTVAQAALDKANSDLTYTRLLAPYDGVISKRYMRVFQYAQMQEPVLGIQTESAVDVSFQLPEQFIGALQRLNRFDNDHAAIQVKFDSRDEWFVAGLKELNTVADPDTGSYTLVVTLPIPEQLNVLPGMAASVKAVLPSDVNDGGLKVSEGAILESDGQSYVFRWLEGLNRVEKVPVVVESNRIIKGLNDGDWLVVAGASELVDGQNAVRWIKERGL